jgi:uncharacterized membrane protein
MLQESLHPLAAVLPLLIALIAIVDAARRARWSAPHREHTIWALATAMILAGHFASVTLPDGEQLHYLGAAWLALLLGYPRAVLSMSAVISAQMLWQDAPLSTWGLRVTIMAVLPVWTMWAIVEGAKRWAPRNLFVFLLGCGLLGIALVNMLQLGLTAIAMTVLGAHRSAVLWSEFVPYGLLLSWGEAWLEGMLTTLLVVYVPGSVRLFDERFYLARR